MNSLVIYDSNFGNTKMIAEAIGMGLGASSRVIFVKAVKKDDLQDVQLLVIGSPINGWRATKEIQKLLADLQKSNHTGLRVAAFDTRMKVFYSGNAARRIAQDLEKTGAKLILPPEGFYVKGKSGPLVASERARAEHWGAVLLQKMNKESSGKYVPKE
jgi:flavodoxin